MANDRRIAVAMALTPDVELLPLVETLVTGVAALLGFGESQRRSLRQGVEQACRHCLEKCREQDEEMRLQFAGFSDRLEIVVEDGQETAEMSEADSYLLSQLLDRIVYEETEGGKLRLTLIQYLSGAESQP